MIAPRHADRRFMGQDVGAASEVDRGVPMNVHPGKKLCSSDSQRFHLVLSPASLHSSKVCVPMNCPSKSHLRGCIDTRVHPVRVPRVFPPSPRLLKSAPSHPLAPEPSSSSTVSRVVHFPPLPPGLLDRVSKTNSRDGPSTTSVSRSNPRPVRVDAHATLGFLRFSFSKLASILAYRLLSRESKYGCSSASVAWIRFAGS